MHSCRLALPSPTSGGKAITHRAASLSRVPPRLCGRRTFPPHQTFIERLLKLPEGAGEDLIPPYVSRVVRVAQKVRPCLPSLLTEDLRNQLQPKMVGRGSGGQGLNAPQPNGYGPFRDNGVGSISEGGGLGAEDAQAVRDFRQPLSPPAPQFASPKSKRERAAEERRKLQAKLLEQQAALQASVDRLALKPALAPTVSASPPPSLGRQPSLGSQTARAVGERPAFGRAGSKSNSKSKASNRPLGAATDSSSDASASSSSDEEGESLDNVPFQITLNSARKTHSTPGAAGSKTTPQKSPQKSGSMTERPMGRDEDDAESDYASLGSYVPFDPYAAALTQAKQQQAAAAQTNPRRPSMDASAAGGGLQRITASPHHSRNRTNGGSSMGGGSMGGMLYLLNGGSPPSSASIGGGSGSLGGSQTARAGGNAGFDALTEGAEVDSAPTPPDIFSTYIPSPSSSHAGSLSARGTRESASEARAADAARREAVEKSRAKYWQSPGSSAPKNDLAHAAANLVHSHQRGQSFVAASSSSGGEPDYSSLISPALIAATLGAGGASRRGSMQQGSGSKRPSVSQAAGGGGHRHSMSGQAGARLSVSGGVPMLDGSGTPRKDGARRPSQVFTGAQLNYTLSPTQHLSPPQMPPEAGRRSRSGSFSAGSPLLLSPDGVPHNDGSRSARGHHHPHSASMTGVGGGGVAIGAFSMALPPEKTLRLSHARSESSAGASAASGSLSHRGSGIDGSLSHRGARASLSLSPEQSGAVLRLPRGSISNGSGANTAR